MQLKILALLALPAAALVFGARKEAVAPAIPETYEVVTAYVGGGEEGQELPLIVLLHAEDSDAAEALDVLATLDQPARVLVPLGRFPTAGGRHSYLGLEKSGDEYAKAQRDEIVRLAAWLATVAPSGVPQRVIVIGLRASGALACALGLGAPLLVRQAYGTGGAVPASWVPLSLPPLNNMSTPQVSKITFGLAVPVDAAAVKLAESRGMVFSTMTTFAVPTEAVITKWLIPRLAEFLTTP